MRIRFSHVFTVIFGAMSLMLFLTMRGMTEQPVLGEHSLRNPAFLKAVVSELLLNPHVLTDPEISYQLQSLLSPLCNSYNETKSHQPLESLDPIVLASPSATSSTTATPSHAVAPSSSATRTPSTSPPETPSRTPSPSTLPPKKPSRSPSPSEEAPSPSISKSPIPSPSKSPSASPSLPSISQSPEFAPSVSSTPSPTPASPSASPTPMAKYIRTNLEGGPFPRSTPFAFKTTINTAVTVPVTDLVTHPDFPEGTVESVVPSPDSASNGTVVIDEEDIIYTPFKWFEGVDNITFIVTTSNDDSEEETQTELVVPVFVRFPVLMTKSITDIPEDYEIREIGKKMTEEMGVALKNKSFVELMPETDYWLNRKFSSCAIIGSGGSLKNSKRGKEIDSHEIVVRLNLAPFMHENFTEDVGTHLNIRFTNGGLSPLCWKPGTFDLPANTSYEIMAQGTTAAQFDKYVPCVAKKSFYTYHMMSYYWIDLVDAILVSYHLRDHSKDKVPRFRSTGMIAVTTMITVCEHVSMYGFENGADNTHHYWEVKPGKREWINHSYSAEKEFYKDLAKGDGLFMQHMSHYDLYKSFKYIVD